VTTPTFTLSYEYLLVATIRVFVNAYESLLVATIRVFVNAYESLLVATIRVFVNAYEFSLCSYWAMECLKTVITFQESLYSLRFPLFSRANNFTLIA